jgi:hypothetical protein
MITDPLGLGYPGEGIVSGVTNVAVGTANCLGNTAKCLNLPGIENAATGLWNAIIGASGANSQSLDFSAPYPCASDSYTFGEGLFLGLGFLFPGVDEAELGELAAGALPLGFADAGAFARFSYILRSGLDEAGYSDTEAALRGSAVTGTKFSSGAPFDAASDLDVALSGQTIFDAARAAGLALRGGGVRTGPLTAAQVDALGLGELQQTLTGVAGRPVSFMVYRSQADIAARGPNVSIP